MIEAATAAFMAALFLGDSDLVRNCLISRKETGGVHETGLVIWFLLFLGFRSLLFLQQWQKKRMMMS